MHPFIPLTDEDKKAMLDAIGVDSVSDLFAGIPKPIHDRLNIADRPALSELELRKYFKELAKNNAPVDDMPSFLGGGAYQHYIPSTVGSIMSRGDFFSAYTPYQPEVSQGTLHAIYEFQSMTAALTQMPVMNASMYDGGSSTAEAALMAQRVTRKNKVLVAESLHPHYRQIVDTYNQHLDGEIITAPCLDNGLLDVDALEGLIDGDTAGLMVQSPNFFGLVEDLDRLAAIMHAKKALLIAVATEAMAFGLLKGPGASGADIFAGEGQSFGLPVGYGGPYVGLFGTTEKFVRKMPGRLAGKTIDAEGRPGYVLTLSTREQHIRREKATSNICTNQGLCALAATVYLATMGKQGVRKAAEQSAQAATYLRHQLISEAGCTAKFNGAFFNEFVVTLPVDAKEWSQKLADDGFLAGIPLHGFFPERFTDRDVLLCATELHDKATIDAFVKAAAKVAPAVTV